MANEISKTTIIALLTEIWVKLLMKQYTKIGAITSPTVCRKKPLAYFAIAISSIKSSTKPIRYFL